MLQLGGHAVIGVEDLKLYTLLEEQFGTLLDDMINITPMFVVLHFQPALG